jgi:hypothetical protein
MKTKTKKILVALAAVCAIALVADIAFAFGAAAVPKPVPQAVPNATLECHSTQDEARRLDIVSQTGFERGVRGQKKVESEDFRALAMTLRDGKAKEVEEELEQAAIKIDAELN